MSATGIVIILTVYISIIVVVLMIFRGMRDRNMPEAAGSQKNEKDQNPQDIMKKAS